MDVETDDLHLCLNCHTAISGLQNYIDHKRSHCPAKVKSQVKETHEPFSQLKEQTSEQSFIPNCLEAKIPSDTIVKTCNVGETFLSPSTVGTQAVSLTGLENSKPFPSPTRYPLEIFPTEVGQQFVTTLFGSPVKVDPRPVCSERQFPISSAGSESQTTQKESTGKKLESCNKDSENENMPDAATVAEFFSSLELKVREPTDKHPCDLQNSPLKTTSLQSVKDDPFEERLKNIKISNILTELHFSSDSEGLPSDVEELLNFSDADIDESEKAMHGGKWKPSGSIQPYNSRGKWRPGGKGIDIGKYGKKTAKLRSENASEISCGKSRSENIAESTGGKSRPENVQGSTSGKWKPGQRVAHGIGKHGKLRAAYKAYRGLTESEDEAETDTNKKTKTTSPSDKSPTVIWCEDCQKSFKSKYYSERHKATAYHKRHAKKTNSAGKKTNFKCNTCNKVFQNKYNLARHLASDGHLRQEDNDNCEESVGKSKTTGNQSISSRKQPSSSGNQSVNFIDPSLQMLLLRQKPFQCRVCDFQCNQNSELLSHITSDNHTKNVHNLLGPIMCVRCKFVTNSNQDLVEHFSSQRHSETMDKSDRPCVIKESRTNIPCQACDKTLTSLTKLQQHLASVHYSGTGPRQVKHKGQVNRPQCPYCNSRWNCEAALQIHIRRRHSGERPFVCEACKVSFSSKSDLSRHYTSSRHIEMAMQLGAIKPQTIPETRASSPCEEKTPSTANTTHKAKRSKVKRLCKYQGCTFETSTLKELVEHYSDNHKNSPRFYCAVCRYKANAICHWRKHCRSARHIELVKASEVDHQDSEDPENDTRFPCDECNLSFSTELTLHKHRVLHTVTSENELMRECDGDEFKYLDKRHHEFVRGLPSDKTASVQCRECGLRTTRGQIVEHLRSHSSISPFHCIYCDKSFHRGDRLKAHLMVHFPKKWHSCEYCPARYKDIKSLRQHILSRHPKQVDFPVDYICSTCGYQCVSKSLLSSHILVHLDNKQKRFRCPWKGCTTSFQFKCQLTSHLSFHRKEKPYLCDQCGFKAMNRQYLNRHKRKHTGIRPYKCDYCTYSYFTSSGLRRHMRSHINSRPYRCPYPDDCDFRANTLEQIRKHVNHSKKHVTNGDWLYPCRRCDKGFTSQGDLKTHLSDEHNVELAHSETSLGSIHPQIVIKRVDHKMVPAGQKVNPVKEHFVAKKWRQQVYNGDVDRGDSVERDLIVEDKSLSGESVGDV